MIGLTMFILTMNIIHLITRYLTATMSLILALAIFETQQIFPSNDILSEIYKEVVYLKLMKINDAISYESPVVTSNLHTSQEWSMKCEMWSVKYEAWSG